MTERIGLQMSQLNEKFEVFKSVVANPPRSLGHTWEGDCTPDQVPICFEDALGRSFSVPLAFCRTMNVCFMAFLDYGCREIYPLSLGD